MAITKKELEEMIASKLSHFFGVTPKDATDEQFYRALSIISRDMVRDSRREFDKISNEQGQKIIFAWSSLWAEALKTRSITSI